MHAASREALAATRTALEASLVGGTDGAAAAATGSDLFSVVDALAAERSLRSVLSDPASEPAAKERLADAVFGGRIVDGAAEVLRVAVGKQWSAGSDLVAALEQLGREAFLASAEQQGLLETVEDELFRLGRIISGNADLEIALTDRTATAERKRALISGLLYGKVTPVTEALVTQAVGRLRGSPALALDTLSNLTAARRKQIVAHVRSAAQMSDQQVRRLSDSLERLYGRKVTAHIEIAPELLSGLVVRVGDEVIDGSGSGRLAAVRKAIG